MKLVDGSKLESVPKVQSPAKEIVNEVEVGALSETESVSSCVGCCGAVSALTTLTISTIRRIRTTTPPPIMKGSLDLVREPEALKFPPRPVALAPAPACPPKDRRPLRICRFHCEIASEGFRVWYQALRGGFESYLRDWDHTRKAGFEGVPELQMIHLVAPRTVHDIPQPALVEDARVRFADNLVAVDGAFLSRLICSCAAGHLLLCPAWHLPGGIWVRLIRLLSAVS